MPREPGAVRPPQTLEFSMTPLRLQGVQARLRLLGPLLGRVPTRVPCLLFRLHAFRLLAKALRPASKAVQIGRGGRAWHRGVAAARKTKGRCDQEKKDDRGFGDRPSLRRRGAGRQYFGLPDDSPAGDLANSR